MKTNFEVIIIGGSYAGLSAAMALGRAMREALIIDSGKPCNMQTPHSHNFITQDGEAPAVIAAKAREQVLSYPTVTFTEGVAETVIKTDTGFTVTLKNGTVYQAKKVLFATGIKDSMPEIEGFAECWGISIIHCPYCHGYEVRRQKTAIFANDDAAYHYAVLLSQWTKKLTIFTNDTPEFTTEQTEKLQQHAIEVIKTPIAKLVHEKGRLQQINLADGTSHNFNAMYHRAYYKQHCDIPEQLGCTINEQGFIQANMMQKTTVAGIFAAGDCTRSMRSVSTAVAQGTMAGAAINAELCQENF